MIHNNRGVAQLKLNHLQNAISDFNQALQFHAANVGALYNRGRVFRQQGDYTSALQDFTQVIQLVPNYAPAYFNRGLLRHQQGSPAAIADLRKAAECFYAQGATNAYQRTRLLIQRINFVRSPQVVG